MKKAVVLLMAVVFLLVSASLFGDGQQEAMSAEESSAVIEKWIEVFQPSANK